MGACGGPKLYNDNSTPFYGNFSSSLTNNNAACTTVIVKDNSGNVIFQGQVDHPLNSPSTYNEDQLHLHMTAGSWAAIGTFHFYRVQYPGSTINDVETNNPLSYTIPSTNPDIYIYGLAQTSSMFPAAQWLNVLMAFDSGIPSVQFAIPSPTGACSSL